MQASAFNLTTVIARSQQLVHCELGDEVTIMSVESGKYYATSAVGARIWRLIEQPAAIGDVCAHLGESYRVDRGRCEEEVLEFIRRLVEEDLVIVVSSSAER